MEESVVPVLESSVENSSEPKISCPEDVNNTLLGTEVDNAPLPVQLCPTKRELRKQLKKEKWLANLPGKRAREKQKLKQKRLDARLNNIDLGPSRKRLKQSKMSTSNCKVRVAIDMSFDELMSDKDIAKCTKQLLRCYSLNRRAENPLQLYITSFNGKTLEEMQKHNGYQNWDINFCPESVFDVFKHEDLVYLTSDSDNLVTELDDSKTYIIGGLVDHNSQKGHCFELAKSSGVSHAQLPIGEYLEMKSRKVLAINHVYEILVAVSGGKTWQEAFISTLPSRKGAVVKLDGTMEEDQ